jgi:galactosamine-6-phosphate isomerase
MNGHLGLNEPNDSLVVETHVAELDEKTKNHSMIRGHYVTRGITLAEYVNIDVA